MFTVQITAKSPLMLGSGTGRGSFIDADIIVDEYGLPMFPGKRLKGLLKESAVEVMEMLEQSGMHGFFDRDIIEIAFGTSTSPACIKIGNLYLTDEQNTAYPDIKRWLQYLIHEDNHQFINKETVVNALTEIRQQTAINKDGYAKVNSLRTTRVLRAGKNFVGTIDCSREHLKEQIGALLALACGNLKHAGSGRNRGLGEIECYLYSGEKQDLVKHAVAMLENWMESEKPFSLSNGEKDCEVRVTGQNLDWPDGNPEDKYMLEYLITSASPLLFTSPEGDENMVNTLDYIPGSALLGYYANRFIRIKGLEPATAQEDKYFKSWFIDGKLLFSNAYLFLEEYDLPLYTTPYFIHTDKQGMSFYNLLDEECEETKALGGYCAIIGDEIFALEPRRGVNFHLVRNDERNPDARIEGCIREGGIYNYESIMPGQVFHGCITGPKQDLEQFLGIFGTETDIKLGRSINTQYGSVKIQYKEIKPGSVSLDSCYLGNGSNDNNYPPENVLMCLVSPLVLYNNYGFPSTEEKDLIALLQEKLDRKDIRVTRSFARIETRQGFMSHLKVHEAGFSCWSAGSAFILEFPGDIDNQLEEKLKLLMVEGIGEKRHMGYGQVRFMTCQMPDIKGCFPHYDKQYEKPEGLVPGIIKEILTNIINHQLNRIVAATALERAKAYSEENKYNRLSSNLLGRLERIIEGSLNTERMKTEIEMLRKKAKDPLEEFTFNRTSLYNDLTEMKLKKWCEEQRDKHWRKLTAISKYIDYELIPDYKLYWRVFLRTMRKLYKKQQQTEKEGR